MDESEIRDRAIRRIKAKREFRHHLRVYVGVNLLLIAIWAVTSPGGYFWPVWPLLGWGIGLFFHGYEVYNRKPIGEDEINREIQLLGR